MLVFHGLSFTLQFRKIREPQFLPVAFYNQKILYLNLAPTQIILLPD